MLLPILTLACLVLVSDALPSRVQSPALSKRQSSSDPVVTDVSTISAYWGQIRPYMDNPDSYFGVQNVGLPDGCQIEQVQILQRHGEFPGEPMGKNCVISSKCMT